MSLNPESIQPLSAEEISQQYHSTYDSQGNVIGVSGPDGELIDFDPGEHLIFREVPGGGFIPFVRIDPIPLGEWHARRQTK